MDYSFFLDWGYWGMCIAGFVAGSVFPFSSEAVFVAMLVAGLDPLRLLSFATCGNTCGSMFNYWMGTLGRAEWFSRYLHVSPSALEKAQRFVAGRGALMGFFCFLPIIGSAISVVLGLMRSNWLLVLLSVFLGKLLRYVWIVLAYCSLW